MEKKDLKTGMVVELRNGDRYIVIDDKLIKINCWKSLTMYTNDLIARDFDCLSIIKIFHTSYGFTFENLKDGNNLELIWELKKIKYPQITKNDREFLNLYVKYYHWVVRDETGRLKLFDNKPFKLNSPLFNGWFAGIPAFISCDDTTKDLLNFIKWEDEEPYRIDDLLGE